MLELLAQGGSGRTIAATLGYREGSTRVYLHELYKKLGVNNKTAALLWYLEQSGKTFRHNDMAAGSPETCHPDRSFGDMALRTNLFVALGVMNMFLGPYGKSWEVGHRLKGGRMDPRLNARRGQSRLLWEALLKGDFAYGKRLYDEDATVRILVDSPSDGVLLALLLLIGGYTGAAARVIAHLAAGRKGGVGVTLAERTLVLALRDALNANSGEALAGLYQLAAGRSSSTTIRQIAMVALYWAYRARKDSDRARGTANAICAEAEAARQQLQALGERPVYGDATLPRPAAMKARSARSYVRKLTGASAALKEG
jgi:hypothetical protein